MPGSSVRLVPTEIYPNTDVRDCRAQHGTKVVFLAITRRMHAHDALRMEELRECPFSLCLFGWIKNPERRAAVLVQEGEARDIGEAVADVNHVLERDPTIVLFHSLVDEIRVGGGLPG